MKDINPPPEIRARMKREMWRDLAIGLLLTVAVTVVCALLLRGLAP